MRFRGRVKPSELAMQLLLLVCALTAVVFVLLITVYLILSGLPAIREVGLLRFLFGRTWDSANPDTPSFGILPLILTTIYGTAGAIAAGVPIGIFTAIFLAKAAPRPLARLIRPAIGILAGIPSVVYGLVGMCALVPLLRRWLDLPAGDSLLAAVIVLAVMILPSIIAVTQTALEAVPREFEEASLALGATELETYFRVTVPAAKSGIAAAVALGVGRATGEAMAILMVAGNVANMPSLLGSVRFLTTGIAIEMNYAAPGSLQRQALFSIGLVLFVFILLINILLSFVLKSEKEG